MFNAAPTARLPRLRPAGLALAVLVTAAVGCLAVAAPRDEPSDHAPFAVVELFTSQGCSSCPPADALLDKVAADAATDGRNLLALSWHVDYWDRLGWADPFSSAAATARQRRYAKAMHADRVYTPQAIVNGRVGFVGSNEAELERAVAAALTQKPTAAVALPAVAMAKTTGPSAVSVSYAVADAPAGADLVVAVAEDGLVTRIERGENGGRTLRQEHVVRAFRVVNLATDPHDGDVTIPLPAGVDAAHLRVVAFVQDRETMAILGAASAVPSDAAKR